MAQERFKAFAAYIDGLESIAVEAIARSGPYAKSADLHPILNGQPAREFRDQIPLETRRSSGMFFTGALLARRLSKRVLSDLPPDAVIADPACGLGDLLLAAARELPTGPDLLETLRIWGGRLMGFDTQPEFVRATKIRLLLLAVVRSQHGGSSSIPKIADLFPRIYVRDFIACPQELAKASHILLNPPYNQVLAPPGCVWGNRRISAAALFMDVCLSHATAGTKIGALLPDVLRAGSYYGGWRQYIESLSKRVRIATYGQFDNWTDVDVFILDSVKAVGRQTRKATWWKMSESISCKMVGDYFDVHVGPVVPHRDPKKGPRLAYVHARTLPPWQTLKRINERRRFIGTVFVPPFVAVRRTSRPGDKRAIATVITGRREVAVENHVIVLVPKNQTIDKCRRLVRILKARRTDRWLDERIRCRHLTVRAISHLPWWRP